MKTEFSSGSLLREGVGKRGELPLYGLSEMCQFLEVDFRSGLRFLVSIFIRTEIFRLDFLK